MRRGEQGHKRRSGRVATVVLKYHAPVRIVDNKAVMECLETMVPNLDVDERRLGGAHHFYAATLVVHKSSRPSASVRARRKFAPCCAQPPVACAASALARAQPNSGDSSALSLLGLFLYLARTIRLSASLSVRRPCQRRLAYRERVIARVIIQSGRKLLNDITAHLWLGAGHAHCAGAVLQPRQRDTSATCSSLTSMRHSDEWSGVKWQCHAAVRSSNAGAHNDKEPSVGCSSAVRHLARHVQASSITTPCWRSLPSPMDLARSPASRRRGNDSRFRQRVRRARAETCIVVTRLVFGSLMRSRRGPPMPHSNSCAM